ncbi:MAG: excinuclease ABC subunit UvrA [Thermogutta sp.]
MSSAGNIVLRGVRVHNLKNIDVDIPKKRLVVLCGPSGSGKTSLAVDTVYNEGRRRYLESFSAHTRQFLDNLPRADADRIEGISPAVAVTAWQSPKSQRATVATVTEIYDYLRLLYASLGRVVCLECGRPVEQHTPRTILRLLETFPSGTRMMLAFPAAVRNGQDDATGLLEELRAEGYTRMIVGGRSCGLDEATSDILGSQSEDNEVLVLLDRIIWGRTDAIRVLESLESAFRAGEGVCVVLAQEGEEDGGEARRGPTDSSHPSAGYPEGRGANDGGCNEDRLHSAAFPRVVVDGVSCIRMAFRDRWICAACQAVYSAPEPRLFNFNSLHGACPTCEGFGTVTDVDLDRVVPDRGKSLAQGAVTVWEGQGRGEFRDRMLRSAADAGLQLDLPVAQFTEEQMQRLLDGDAESGFVGIRGYLRDLEKKRYRADVRGVLMRCRAQNICPDCRGARLRREALAVRLPLPPGTTDEDSPAAVAESSFAATVAGPNIAELCRLQVAQALTRIRGLEVVPEARRVARTVLEQLIGRLTYLDQVGLGYLSLDRPIKTLSGGELRRVLLAGTLGSSLVNMVYVLDEPSAGLHPRDVAGLVHAVAALRDRGNTVLVVEHEEAFLRNADQVIELGPGAGERGGQVVFQGPPDALTAASTLTADHLGRRRGYREQLPRRRHADGWIRLCGAKGHNLKNITVEFPLGVLCVVSGVSGAGKSSLVQQTLYPALCRRFRKNVDPPLPYDDLLGEGQIADVVLVDQSSVGHTSRSCVATFLKIWDDIRRVFAESADARTRGMGPRHFSFNSDEGACEECGGEGYLEIDMQFLADVRITCPRCRGRRFREEILDVFHRGKNPADVLEMTVREAFAFFRGYPKVQAKLKRLIEVGLDYLRLGQAAQTLSGGESQRLRLAAHLSAGKRSRTLFLLEEPSTGLHDADVTLLLDNFESLLNVGHSLIVVEHHLSILAAADYLIDLGPGAGDAGGQVVAAGTPEEVLRCPESVTASYLAPLLKPRTRAKSSAERTE